MARTTLVPLAVFLLSLLQPAHASTFTVIYTFHGGNDGFNPTGRITYDKAGNLYGTTRNGGDDCKSPSGLDCGTAWALAPDGTKTVLYSFGAHPRHGRSPSGLIRDDLGNLYGMTAAGGSKNDGTVFAIASSGRQSVLHSFSGQDGISPYGDLAQDTAGNLYGTTLEGNGFYGSAFELTPGGTQTTLHLFTGGSDGANPYAGLTKDTAGNLYGTTFYGGGAVACGGQPPTGCGTVFKIAPDGTETVLYAFTAQYDGAFPVGRLAIDASGNLYGTTISSDVNGGNGTAFEVSPSGNEKVLHYFSGGNDGAVPFAGVVLDNSGNLYGTTFYGGAYCDCGTVWEIAPSGTETILHTFSESDGAEPEGDLLLLKGDLYGTASAGGDGYGTVFKLTP
ncbi:MAG: choice-of-anchor tandem repeat GloVer-containing protein [Rhizomicrobium sp.]